MGLFASHRVVDRYLDFLRERFRERGEMGGVRECGEGGRGWDGGE